MSCTDTVRPFYSNIRSFGISIDGEGQLFSDTAFIRVVLVDNYDHEWLVYERNTLYATEENTQFQDAAFETNALYDIVPKFLTVTLCDATLYLANVKSNRNAKDRNTVAAMSDSAFLSKNLQIVERINTKLSAHKRNETVSPFFRICNAEAVRPAFAMRDETKITQNSLETERHTVGRNGIVSVPMFYHRILSCIQ